ncbi:tripartite tricarboxylate transporter substrate binding protein [Pseudooceanicola sp.]|uniref:tripartite tricarboxylate transporter substrate binding protein n=1 Tax=Pseudooceanicola sp. TaxID=1914328 RepID=UPI0035140CEF
MTIPSTMRRWVLGALAATGVAAAVPAMAEDFPDKPVTVTIPFSAGGSHDVNARIFTSILPSYLGQPVVIKLTPGAGGQAGTAAAIKAPADGYSMLFTHSLVDQLQPLVANLPYDTTAALTTVARINTAPAIFYVLADSPWQTIDDLVTYAKENPGELRYAHSGKWGTGFTGGAAVADHYGIEMTYLPYKGGGPMKLAVLSGDADFTLGRPGTIGAEIEAGKVRALLVGADERLPELPDTPTTTELGMPTEAIVMQRIVQVPSDLPEDRMQVLRTAFRELQEDKTYLRMMSQMGENVEYMDGPDYEKLRRQQAESYSALVQALTGQ